MTQKEIKESDVKGARQGINSEITFLVQPLYAKTLF